MRADTPVSGEETIPVMPGMSILARDLLFQSLDNLEKTLPERFVLVCDDGEIRTTRQRTLYTHFFWEYHRVFTDTPLRTAHTLEVALAGKPYNSNTHLKLIESIAWDVSNNVQPGSVSDLTGKISFIAYQASIGASNHFTLKLPAFITPIDVLDTIAIARHPKLLAAIEEFKNDPNGVKKTYDVAEYLLMKDPAFDRNGLAISCRSGTVKIGQVLQSVAPRGDATEADGRVFDDRIHSGYFEGHNSIYEYAADSRGAPKALGSTEKPIQDNDYMARRFQLLVSAVEGLAVEDCGAEMVEWLILPEVRDTFTGEVSYEGGVKFMIGKIYEDPETKEIKEIKGNETHLNGKYVRLRTALNCKHANAHKVCRTCFGGLWRNVYEHANLGHWCSVTMTERIIQATLGIKHHVGSARGEGIRLDTLMRTYFVDNPKDNASYFINPLMDDKKLHVTLQRSEAMKLSEVLTDEDKKDEHRISKLTRLTLIKMSHEVKGQPYFDFIDLSQAGPPAYATQELIDYLEDHPLKIDDDNNFVVDLHDWDNKWPLFTVPRMETSAAQHGQEVGKMIESSMSNINDRQRPDSPMKTLHELFELVTLKLPVPMSCLEVIMYAFMVPARNNPALARGWDNAVLGVARDLITSRSLSSALAFQGHVDFMLNAKAFFPHFRPDIKLDVFFAPQEVTAQYPKVI